MFSLCEFVFVLFWLLLVAHDLNSHKRAMIFELILLFLVVDAIHVVFSDSVFVPISHCFLFLVLYVSVYSLPLKMFCIHKFTLNDLHEQEMYKIIFFSE